MRRGPSHYLIWDFDGTLAHRDTMWSGAIAKAANLRGSRVEREHVKPYLRSGFPWHEPHSVRERETADAWWERMELVFVRALVEGAGCDEPLARLVARDVRKIYLDPVHWRIFDDVHDCLQRLSAEGWRHVILSNHTPELAALVGNLGLAGHFERVFTSGELGVEKPHPRSYAAVKDWAPSDAILVMVGDSFECDVLGPERSGIRSILVRSRHDAARRTAADLREIVDLLAADVGTS